MIAAIEGLGTTGQTLFQELSQYLSQRFGLCILVADAKSNLKHEMEVANLRDGVVQLSPARSLEQQAFILSHVFGHLVQHLDRSAHIALLDQVESPPPIAMTTALKRQYFRYEMDAYAWGEVLIRQCVQPTDDFLHRYATYAAVDFSTYSRYLETGRRVEENCFQLFYERSLRASKKQLWDATLRRLPEALIVDNLEISVV